MKKIRDKERVYLIRILCLGLLAGMAISWPLWLSGRDFPLLPILNGMPALIFPFDYILAVFTGLSIIWLICKPTPAHTWLVIIPMGLLLLTDQMRWQPWVYQYVLMLTVIAVYLRTQKRPESTLNSLRLILFCTYLYSGITKINPLFLENAINLFFPWLIPLLPEMMQPFIHHFSILVIIGELLLAIGLLTRKSKIAAFFLMGMHVAIIFLIVIINRWNPVILPWNIVMILLLYILFVWNDEWTFSDMFWNHGKYTHVFLLVMVGLLPILSLINKWDKYLSFHLYSFSTDNVVITFEPEAKLPEDALWTPHVIKTDSTQTLNIMLWSMHTLHVPVYPEPRVFRKLIREICSDAETTITEIHLGPLYFEKENGRARNCATYK